MIILVEAFVLLVYLYLVTDKLLSLILISWLSKAKVNLPGLREWAGVMS